jgi:hypothetical protein
VGVVGSKKRAQERDVWVMHFFQRHRDDDKRQSVPAQVFLDGIPENVAATMLRVVDAVVAAPPPSFSGGGMWEAMHDEMAGFYEVRVDHDHTHYRLFCVLDRDDDKKELGGNAVVMIDGEQKPFRKTISEKRYKEIRALRLEYQARRPRSVFVDDE